MGDVPRRRIRALLRRRGREGGVGVRRRGGNAALGTAKRREKEGLVHCCETGSRAELHWQLLSRRCCAASSTDAWGWKVARRCEYPRLRLCLPLAAGNSRVTDEGEGWNKGANNSLVKSSRLRGMEERMENWGEYFECPRARAARRRITGWTASRGRRGGAAGFVRNTTWVGGP